MLSDDLVGWNEARILQAEEEYGPEMKLLVDVEELGGMSGETGSSVMKVSTHMAGLCGGQ